MAACSTVRVGYEQLPTLAYWWLDGYLDLDGAQSLQVRAALAQWQADHRRTELPQLSTLLSQAEGEITRDITPEHACRMGEAMRSRVRAAAALAEEPAARVALTFGPAQTDALERRYARNNDEYRREWLSRSPAQQQAKRFRTLRKRYEDLYGRLDTAQLTLLRDSIGRSSFDARLFDAEQRHRQAEVLALLRGWQKQAPSAEAARTAIAGHIDRIHTPPPGPWREQQQAFWREGCADFAALHATTTPAQRARAAQRLKDYARDVQALQSHSAGQTAGH